MKYREVELLAPKAYTDDAVEIIDIDLKDPISQIQFLHESMNIQADQSTAHPAACVTDITVKDGSDILFNLDGFQCQAMDFYHTGHAPVNHICYLSDMENKMMYTLHFGRHLWDKLLALDPTQFSNLQLQITTDMDAGGNAPDAGTLTVFASVFDDKKIDPVGFLTTKEYRTYLGTGETHIRTSLPTDYDYRSLMFRAYRLSKPPENLFDIIKLEENNGKKVPFEIAREEWEHIISSRWPAYTEKIIHKCRADNDDYHHCTPTYWPGLTSNAWLDGDNAVQYMNVYGGDGGEFYSRPNTGHALNCCTLITGHCPHTTLCYPFGDQQDLDDWYSMENVDSLVVDILGRAPGSGYHYWISGQQLRRY